MDLAVSPIQLAPSAQAVAAHASLVPGQVIEAQVQKLLDGGLVRLVLAEGTLDVPTKVPLTPGAIVNLAVEAEGQGLKLVLQGAPTAAAAVAAGNAGEAVAAGNAGQTASATTATTPATTAPQAASPTVATPAQALSAAIGNAVARQNSLAPLFANAATLLQTPGLPPAVQQAAAQLMRLRLPLDDTISADDLRQAATRSGTLLEANLAASLPDQAAAPDLKAALLLLRQVVQNWRDETPAPAAAPAAANGAATPQSTGTTSPTLPAPPPPPYPGAPTLGQPPAAPSIVPDMPAHDIAEHLIADTDAGLARQTLLQAASLPDRSDLGHGIDRGAPRWNFEIPLATPQGTAMAQFEISRDAPGRGGPDSERLWRVRFSIDAEPMGAVHAQVSLYSGGEAPARTAVTLWAERPDVAARLRADAPQLAEALRKAELDPGDVLVRGGEPPATGAAPKAGRFLDRAT